MITDKGLYLGHIRIGPDRDSVLVTATDGNVMMSWDDWIKTPDGKHWSERNAVTADDVKFAADFNWKTNSRKTL